MRPPLVMRWGAGTGDPEVKAQLDQANDALAATTRRLVALEEAHAQCELRIRELQERTSSLVQLTVASQLLSGGSDREDVLNAMEEIIINMIGSEEIAILELPPNEARVRVTRTRGIDGRSPRFARAAEPIREAIASGRVIFPQGREVTAVIPLKLGETLFGVIAIFRLLEQKPALDALDHELLELLSRQGPVAILSTVFCALKPTVRPPSKGPR